MHLRPQILFLHLVHEFGEGQETVDTIFRFWLQWIHEWEYYYQNGIILVLGVISAAIFLYFG